jgi:hypothetical protein
MEVYPRRIDAAAEMMGCAWVSVVKKKKIWRRG